MHGYDSVDRVIVGGLGVIMTMMMMMMTTVKCVINMRYAIALIRGKERTSSSIRIGLSRPSRVGMSSHHKDIQQHWIQYA